MSEYKHLQVEIEDGVAILTLNRPEVANALNFDMTHDLFLASIECDENPAIRAVVLTGAGKLFCGGGDLPEFAGKGLDVNRHLKLMTTFLHAAVSRFARMDAPLIGAINGTAGGAGFSLVCSCDLAYIAETAKLTLAYTAAALTPDGSSTYYLPRLIGTRRALELALTNRRLTAAEALEWGLVNQVLPADEVLTAAVGLAKQLAQGPTLAYGGAKRLLYQSLNQTLESQMEHEARTIAAISTSADAQEGIAAFLEKRRPEFKGK